MSEKRKNGDESMARRLLRAATLLFLPILALFSCSIAKEFRAQSSPEAQAIVASLLIGIVLVIIYYNVDDDSRP